MKSPLAALVFATLMLTSVIPAAYAAAPRVVVSIKPLQSLVAGVMEGIAVPDVLIKGGGSLHAYALRPSEAEALSKADLVLWIGPVFETFLVKPLAALGGRARIEALIDTPGMKALPARFGGLWDLDDDHGVDRDDRRVDGHIWLDPQNAKVLVVGIARTLGAMDQGNADRYQRNAGVVLARLDALDAELRTKLAPVRGIPFVVFHDAYQYFEAAYGLRAVASVTVSADRVPGARRITQVKEKIVGLGATCVFAEPQFEPKLVRTLLSGTRAKSGVLDPEGSALAPGPDFHFNMARNLADNLVRCLVEP